MLGFLQVLKPIKGQIQIKYEMRVWTLVRDISFNSQHIKNSSHDIEVHLSATRCHKVRLFFAIKRRDRSFCSRLGRSEFEASKLQGNIKYQKTSLLAEATSLLRSLG